MTQAHRGGIHVVKAPHEGAGKISMLGWHTVPFSGRVPLPKYWLNTSAVQFDGTLIEVCCARR